MRALIVNIGNTRTVCAAWEDASRLPVADAAGRLPVAVPLREVAALATPRRRPAEAPYAAGLDAVLASCGRPPVALVSVVPRAAAILREVAPAAVAADHTRPLPFRHELRDAAATGADRLCNVAAAAAAGLSSALVVDAGTATTCDVLRNGVFLGGVIAPGMAFAQTSLGRTAARLRDVPFGPAPLRAGADTRSAMAAGGFHAGVGGIEHLVAGLQRAHGPLTVVLTGGLASYLAAAERHLDPDWTLRGAACLAGFAS